VNDVILEDRYEENASVQIKTSRNPKDASKELCENKFQKIACLNKMLESPWKNIFVLEFLLYK